MKNLLVFLLMLVPLVLMGQVSIDRVGGGQVELTGGVKKIESGVDTFDIIFLELKPDLTDEIHVGYLEKDWSKKHGVRFFTRGMKEVSYERVTHWSHYNWSEDMKLKGGSIYGGYKVKYCEQFILLSKDRRIYVVDDSGFNTMGVKPSEAKTFFHVLYGTLEK